MTVVVDASVKDLKILHEAKNRGEKQLRANVPESNHEGCDHAHLVDFRGFHNSGNNRYVKNILFAVLDFCNGRCL